MSIDAAVAKIPKGWRYDLTSDDWPAAPGKWGCELMGPKFMTLAPSHRDFKYHYAHGSGKTAAEAIESAIKARSVKREMP